MGDNSLRLPLRAAFWLSVALWLLLLTSVLALVLALTPWVAAF